MTAPQGPPDPFLPPPDGGYRPAEGGYQPPPQGFPPPGAGFSPPDDAGHTPPGYASPGYPPAGQAYPPPPGQPQAYPPPGYPPAGQPGSYPPGQIPPPAGTRTKKQRRLIIGVVFVVVAAIVAIVVVKQQKTAVTAANVGDCIKVTSATMTNPDTSQAPCTDPLAIYVVTETGSGSISCDSHEDSYVQGKNTDNPDSRVCLRPNLKTGDCWNPGLTSFDVPKKLDCAAANRLGTQKLLALVTTSSDDSQCPDATEKVLPLAKRNMVYCFGPAS